MLILPIKKQEFDMIRNGIKKEEYREIKPYWTIRFMHNFFNDFCKEYYEINAFKTMMYDIGVHISGNIFLKNGYGRNARQIKCRVAISIGQGKEEWGAEKRKGILYFRNIGGTRERLNRKIIKGVIEDEFK